MAVDNKQRRETDGRVEPTPVGRRLFDLDLNRQTLVDCRYLFPERKKSIGDLIFPVAASIFY